MKSTEVQTLHSKGLCVVELFGDLGTDGVWRVHQLVSLVQDVPVVHVCLVVPASEVRTMHSKQPCHWNVKRASRRKYSATPTAHPIWWSDGRPTQSL